MTVDTVKVAGRRELRFETLDDILADVDRLAASGEVRALGNWSPGQILLHLTLAMNNSLDGGAPMMPGPIRFLLRLFFKGRLLNQRMPPGFKLPKRAAWLLPQPTEFATTLEEFRKSLVRLKAEEKRHPHPAFGPFTREEWDRMHCRHSELHLSFLVPVGS